MKLGVDISKQSSKLISELNEKNFDYVVTICNGSNEKCPNVPSKKKRVYHAFDNPPKLAKISHLQKIEFSFTDA
jgi:arsenate reductase